MKCSIPAISKWPVLQCKPLHCHHSKVSPWAFAPSQNPFWFYLSCREEAIQISPHEGKNSHSFSFSCISVSRTIYAEQLFCFVWFIWTLHVIYAFVLNRFLRLLIEKLRLPAYCLVDCDPYGFDILTTYRFGSLVRFIKLIILLLIYPLEQAKHANCQLGLHIWNAENHANLALILDLTGNSFFSSKWPMMQNIYVAQRYAGLELFLQILKNTVFHSSASFLLQEKVMDATCAVSDKLSYACNLMLGSLIFLSDKRKTESMLNRCYLQRDVPKWR